MNTRVGYKYKYMYLYSGTNFSLLVLEIFQDNVYVLVLGPDVLEKISILRYFSSAVDTFINHQIG